jgi:hypothetical protein
MRTNKYFLSQDDEDELAFLVPYYCCITFVFFCSIENVKETKELFFKSSFQANLYEV